MRLVRWLCRLTGRPCVNQVLWHTILPERKIKSMIFVYYSISYGYIFGLDCLKSFTDTKGYSYVVGMHEVGICMPKASTLCDNF